MRRLIGKLGGMNWAIVALTLVLSLTGIVAVYSASHFRDDPFWLNQAGWVGIGWIVFLVASLIDYRFFKWLALPLYFTGTALLLFVDVSLNETRGGFPSLDRISALLRFQPSQWALVGGILTVGWFLSRFRELYPIEKLIFVGIIVWGPMALIFCQPDVGMTLVWLPIVLCILFAGGLPKSYVLSLLAAGIVLIPVFLHFLLKPYQQTRFFAFIIPDDQPRGASWAIHESLIAVSSGGWDGKGFLATSPRVEEGFIPGTTAHTEFVFTAIAEQFGFVGCAGLITLFALLIAAMLTVAHRATDEFGRLITIGFAAHFFLHIMQNVGMTLALMPVSSLPLPFLSFGGAFVVIVMFGLGLVNSVWVHREPLPVGGLA